MGSLLGGSTKTTSDQKPWEPQGNALKDIFSKAGDLFANKSGTPFYEGDLYANMDPATADAIRSMISYSQNKGANAADQVSDAGADLLDPNGLKSSIQDYQKAAGADPTQANIEAARQYANNPAVDGMIDAASRDVRRNLYETELPGIDRAATGTGNINSTRAGVASAIAQRGAGDRVADISAGIRGDAFNRGLSMAEGSRQFNTSAMGNVAGLYGQQFNQGMGAIDAGRAMTFGNYDAAANGGARFQADAQGQNDADFARWQGADNRESDLLNRYMGIVGANNWGGTTTQTQKNKGSILGSALGVASTVAAFSDRRLKENIVEIGKLENGLPLYSYNYIWGGEPQVGVMADEVAVIRPEALGPMRGGFNTVNYAAL